MLLAYLLLCPAFAGDRELYGRALGLIDEHYLRAADIDRHDMFVQAGRQLEGQIEWLIVDEAPDRLRLRDGGGPWTADVPLGDDLAASLAALEDAVKGAGRPLDPDLDVRVEILRGVVKDLDRHSVILHADGLERFDERLSGTLSGIGATIGPDDTGVTVRELTENGPAARAGLQVGDHILRIDGTATVGMTSNDASERIRGAAGTSVRLTLDRAGGPVDLLIRREEVAIRNVTATRGPRDVGVVAIDHFSEQTSSWLGLALGELADMGVLSNGLIVDLRGNTGGSLVQSAQAADAFLQSGTIVTTVGRDGNPVPSLIPRIDAHPDTPPYAMPIAVLMDHSTASGSEILAGSLARLDRALLIGTNSFGKGTVQKLYQLDESIKLKLTVAEYLLDGGKPVVDVGLQPDVALEPVRFSDNGVWWPAPEREWARLPQGTPIVWHVTNDTPDTAEDVAADVIHAATGGSRAAMLDAANALKDRIIATEGQKVEDAFHARGVDWRAAPPGSASPGDVELHLAFSSPPASGKSTEIEATLINHGPPLYRAAIRLESVNPLWDDRVIAVGWVPTGGTVTGTARVTPARGAAARTDRVTASLETDTGPSRVLDQQTIAVAGEDLPTVAVKVRALRPDADGVRVQIEVDNRGDAALDGVRARFAFPDKDGIELVDSATAPLHVPAHGAAQAALRIRVGAAWTEPTLPLQLLLDNPEYDRLGRFDLVIPRDGRPLRAEPPSVTLGSLPAVLAPGTATLTVRAADDGPLDHVLVFAGPETVNRQRAEPVVEYQRDKVAWQAGTGRKARLDVPLPVTEGTNHYVVVAEDRQGLRTVRDVYVLGDSGAAVAGGG